MSFFYPPLDPATMKALSVVRTLIAEQPNYFGECPYSSEIEAQLREWFVVKAPQTAPKSTQTTSNSTENPENESIFEGLQEEIKALFLHLKSAKNDTGQDKVAYAKAAVPMLEKLVKMEALVINMEMVGSFQRAIMGIMDEVCSPSQRTEVMRRLAEFVTPSSLDAGEILAIENDE